MSGKRFKLTFRSISIRTGLFGMQRALIIAVSPIPGQKGWIQAILACEDGNMIQKPITIIEFEMAARSEVAMVEAAGESAAPALYSIERQAG